MKYLCKKLCTLFITLFIVSVFTFTAFEVIPGDSALSSLGMDASEEAVEQLREERGLNESFLVRYVKWFKQAIRGDFGESYHYNMPVKDLVKDRLLVTVILAVMSIVLIVILSFPLGIFSAGHSNELANQISVFLTHFIMAIPSFFLGMVLTLIFGVILRWFVPGGYISFSDSKIGFFQYMIFPAFAMAIPKVAMMVKFLRSSIKRQMERDYVRTAYSKGSSKKRVLNKHVLKNALIPVITFLGMIIAEVFAGSIVIEQVFNIPGIGRLLVAAISNRDYAVVQAVVLYIASIVVLINLIVDLLYRVIDPRIAKEGGAK